MAPSDAERRQKAVRAMAQGLGLDEATAASRLQQPPPPISLAHHDQLINDQLITPPAPAAGPDDCSEFEIRLFGFLVRIYDELDASLSVGNSILAGYVRDCLGWAISYRGWRRDNPPVDWPAPPDLEDEYSRALAHTTADELRPLRQAGVTDYSLELTRPAKIRLNYLGQGGLFEIDPDGANPAFIVPVRMGDYRNPECEDPVGATRDGTIVDLVAFTPSTRSGTATRYGGADWLGNCPPGKPVRLYPSPIDWLRADCNGLVCLGRSPAELRYLVSRFSAVDVDDQAYAAQLRQLIARPSTEIRFHGRRVDA